MERMKRFMVLAMASYGAALGQNGGISGLVRFDDAQPVTNTVVVYSAVPGKPLKPTGFLTAQVRTNKDGGFQITGLDAGTYRLCVAAQSYGGLDPCLWSSPDPRLELTAGQTVSGFNVQVARGARLQVRVEDPGNRLEAKEKENPPQRLLLMAKSTNGFYFKPRRVEGRSGGRDYELLAPYDTEFQLVARHPSLAIQAEGGRPIDITRPLPVTARRGVSPPRVVLLVAGPL